jgi:acyl-CoA dehydrogenase
VFFKTFIFPGKNTLAMYFTSDHEIFRQSLRDFLAKAVIPHLDDWEEAGEVPRSVFQQFGEMGYFGLAVPEEYGGSEADIWYNVVLQEELSKVNSGGFAAAVGAHFQLALTHLLAEGNEDQEQRYLVPGVRGELIGCLAITEPFGGSDIQSLRTTAIREGDTYVINGSKTFITNGVNSDFIIAAAKTDPQGKGISLFIIDRDTPGVSASKLKKLGWRASDTGEIAFDDVRIPATHLLGDEHAGFFYIMQHFVSERLSMALGSVIGSEHALQTTLQYMSEREAFGRPINKFQELRHRVAQMAAEIEANKVFVYQLYQRYEAGDYLVKEASMAKLLATQLADKVATQCLQIYGGYGYMEDYPMARFFRDARLGQIGGGTSEILCEIIAKMVIDEKVYDKKSIR